MGSFAALLSVVAPPARAQNAAGAPLPIAERGSLGQPVSLLPLNSESADADTGWSGNGAQVESGAVKSGGFARGTRLTIAAKPPHPWESRWGQSNPRPLAGGDVLAVRVWARSLPLGGAAPAQTGAVPVEPQPMRLALVMQQSSDPFPKLLFQEVALSPQWKEYRFVGVVPDGANYKPNETDFEMHLGYGVGTVEVANVRVESYGPAPREQVVALIGGETIDPYVEPEDGKWLPEALKRIEQIRKAPLQVRVVNGKGQPLSGVKVRVEMTRHAFRWGTALSDNPDWSDDTPDRRRYRAEVARLFNTVTLENAMKWYSDNPATQERVEAILAWCHAQHLEVRGHNLVWGSTQYMPRQINGRPPADFTPQELRAAVFDHVRDYATRYKGRVYIWDVVNEATNEHDIWDKVGWDTFAGTYRQAHQADPNAVLCYNDYLAINRTPNWGSEADWLREKALITGLTQSGAPFDVIGEQAHLGPRLVPMKRILANLDELAALGKPIEITEFDVGGSNAEVNGKYVHDFLIAAFSQPQVNGIIQWGFWQGAHWRAKEGAGLFARDWTPLPAERAYEDLVLHQWWTRANGQTGVQGDYTTRGFLGNYQITLIYKGQTRTRTCALSKTSAPLRVVW